MSRAKGVFAVIAASVLYGLLPVFTKAALLQGTTEDAVVFYQFLFMAIAALAVLIMTRRPVRISGRQFAELVFAAVLGYGMTTSLLTMAYARIPVGLAMMFHFSNPVFVTLAMILIYREKATVLKAAAIICAVTGLILMTDLSGMNGMGVLYALLSGITYAYYVVANNKGSFAQTDNVTVVFYIGLINAVFYGLAQIVAGEIRTIPNSASFLFIVIIAVVCTLLPMFSLTYGIRTLGASSASVLNMLEPVVSLLAGMIVYHEVISGKGLIGCLFIVISGIVVVLDDKETQSG